MQQRFGFAAVASIVLVTLAVVALFSPLPASANGITFSIVGATFGDGGTFVVGANATTVVVNSVVVTDSGTSFLMDLNLAAQLATANNVPSIAFRVRNVVCDTDARFEIRGSETRALDADAPLDVNIEVEDSTFANCYLLIAGVNLTRPLLSNRWMLAGSVVLRRIVVTRTALASTRPGAPFSGSSLEFAIGFGLLAIGQLGFVDSSVSIALVDIQVIAGLLHRGASVLGNGTGAQGAHAGPSAHWLWANLTVTADARGSTPTSALAVHRSACPTYISGPWSRWVEENVTLRAYGVAQTTAVYFQSSAHMQITGPGALWAQRGCTFESFGTNAQASAMMFSRSRVNVTGWAARWVQENCTLRAVGTTLWGASALFFTQGSPVVLFGNLSQWVVDRCVLEAIGGSGPTIAAAAMDFQLRLLSGSPLPAGVSLLGDGSQWLVRDSRLRAVGANSDSVVSGVWMGGNMTTTGAGARWAMINTTIVLEGTSLASSTGCVLFQKFVTAGTAMVTSANGGTWVWSNVRCENARGSTGLGPGGLVTVFDYPQFDFASPYIFATRCLRSNGGVVAFPQTVIPLNATTTDVPCDTCSVDVDCAPGRASGILDTTTCSCACTAAAVSEGVALDGSCSVAALAPQPPRRKTRTETLSPSVSRTYKSPSLSGSTSASTSLSWSSSAASLSLSDTRGTRSTSDSSSLSPSLSRTSVTPVLSSVSASASTSHSRSPSASLTPTTAPNGTNTTNVRPAPDFPSCIVNVSHFPDRVSRSQLRNGRSVEVNVTVFPVMGHSLGEATNRVILPVDRRLNCTWGWATVVPITGVNASAVSSESPQVFRVVLNQTVEAAKRGVFDAVTATVVLPRFLFLCPPANDVFLAITVVPEPEPVPEGVRTVTTALATTSTTLGAVLGGPTSGMQQARLGVIASLVACDFPDSNETQPIDVSSSPTQLSFGAPRGAAHRGALLGNAILTLGFTILGAALAIGHWLRSKDKDLQLKHSFGLLHLPGVLIVPVSILVQGTSMSATWLLLHGASGSDKAFAVLALAFLGGLSLGCLALCTKFFGSRSVTRTRHRLAIARPGDEGGANERLRIIYDWATWFLTRRQRWVDLERRQTLYGGFKSRFMHLFSDFRDGRQWWLPLEMILSIVIGCIDGVKNESQCSPVLYGFVTLNLLQLVLAVVLRPFDAPFNTAFHIGISLMTALAALIALRASLGGGTSAAIDAASGGVALAGLVMSALKLFFDISAMVLFVQGRQSRRAQRRAAKRATIIAVAAAAAGRVTDGEVAPAGAGAIPPPSNVINGSFASSSDSEDSDEELEPHQQLLLVPEPEITANPPARNLPPRRRNLSLGDIAALNFGGRRGGANGARVPPVILPASGHFDDGPSITLLQGFGRPEDEAADGAVAGVAEAAATGGTGALTTLQRASRAQEQQRGRAAFEDSDSMLFVGDRRSSLGDTARATRSPDSVLRLFLPDDALASTSDDPFLPAPAALAPLSPSLSRSFTLSPTPSTTAPVVAPPRPPRDQSNPFDDIL